MIYYPEQCRNIDNKSTTYKVIQIKAVINGSNYFHVIFYFILLNNKFLSRLNNYEAIKYFFKGANGIQQNKEQYFLQIKEQRMMVRSGAFFPYRKGNIINTLEELVVFFECKPVSSGFGDLVDEDGSKSESRI